MATNNHSQAQQPGEEAARMHDAHPDIVPPPLPTPSTTTTTTTTAAPSSSSLAVAAVARIPRNRKDHTPAEWEALRPRFTELYLTKRLRLADVSRILEEEDGFCATDKQYKDRIRKWGLRKNFTDDEKRRALATEWNAPSGAAQNATAAVATTSSKRAIPRRRLQRFARDEKLLYIQDMIVGAPLPPEPQAIFDIIIELPRSLFEPNPGCGDCAVHDALAAVDRQMKLRLPILAMDVIGVSDATVRYGLKRVRRRGFPGVGFELLPPSSTPGNEHGPGIQYCASLDTIVKAYGPEEEEGFHLSLFHTISERLFTACQSAYAPETRTRNSLLGRTGEPPGLQCVKFNASSPLATRVLYLRLLGHSALSSSVRYANQMGDAELISTPEFGLAYRIEVGPQETAYMTVKPGMHMAMHIIMRDGLLAGVTRFCHGYETSPFFMGGQIDHESTKMGLLNSPDHQSDTDAASLGPLLAEEDDMVEPGFREASQRAANISHVRPGPKIEVAVTNPLEQTSGPLPTPQRDWMRLDSESRILDRKAPWQLAIRAR